MADGDGPDEDGLAIASGLSLHQGMSFSLPFSYVNTTGSTAHVEAWVDWNGDGDFDDTDEMVANWNDGTTTFPSQMDLTVPLNASLAIPLGFRVRISHTNGMTPYGEISTGEVEDYLLTVDCPVPVCPPVMVTKN